MSTAGAGQDLIARVRARLAPMGWEVLPSVRPALLEALRATLEGGAAETVLDRTLRANRTWDATQRQIVVEALFGVSLWRRRLAFLSGVSEGLMPGRAPELLDAFLADLVHGATSASPAPMFPSFAVELSCPDWLAAHLASELHGEDAARAFLAAINLPGPITARVNTLKTTRPALLERLAQEGAPAAPTRYSPLGVTFEQRPNIRGLVSHRDGSFEIQDEGSQLLGLLVEARPGERVLDLCAGAGGKTLLLGAQMENRGRLDAYDPDLERLERLLRRAENAGVTNVRLLRAPPRDSKADRVLVDAPCSSLGSLRRGPDVRFRLSPSCLGEWVPIQRELLELALTNLAPKGRIVYATCTLNRAENEGLVEAFLVAHSELRAAPFFRVLPHTHGTDGFFAAVLERH